MLKGFILLSVLLLANICCAQQYDDDNKKFFIGFDFGSSYPKRDFGNAGISNLPLSRFTGQDTNKINGFALKGYHYDIYAIYRLIPHFNVILSVNGDKNNIDINTLNSEYTVSFPSNSANTLISGDEFFVTQFLGGLQSSFHVSQSCSIELKALAGFTTGYYPGLSFLSAGQEINYTYPEGNGFGYNFGAGVKYSIEASGNIGLGLHLNVSYAGSNISFSNYSVTTYAISYPNNLISSYTYNVPKTMAIGIIQVAIGFSLEM